MVVAHLYSSRTPMGSHPLPLRGQKKKPEYTACTLTFSLAGVEGFEPPNAGTRTQCLTTWRHPIVAGSLHWTRGPDKSSQLVLFRDRSSFLVRLWRTRRKSQISLLRVFRLGGKKEKDLFYTLAGSQKAFGFYGKNTLWQLIYLL